MMEIETSQAELKYYSFLEHQKELLGEEELVSDSQGNLTEVKISESVKSQRFFNTFLTFMVHLTSFKNRQL